MRLPCIDDVCYQARSTMAAQSFICCHLPPHPRPLLYLFVVCGTCSVFITQPLWRSSQFTLQLEKAGMVSTM